jgi:type II secretory pathway pseudopilin PulG
VIELISVKEEKGYSLLSVILVFAMISILGLSLLTLTINSMKFVTVNKSTIQDKASAEMGIEEAMAQIDSAVEKINKDIENRVLLVDNVLGRLSSSLGSIKSLGPYKYSISHETLKSGQNGVFLEKVIIKAPIGDSKRSITKTITVSTIAEVFKYGAVSPADLTLNGAPYIDGDVLVGKNITTNNRGKFTAYGYFDGGDYWVPTSFPAIKGNLTVKGNYYNQNSNLYQPTQQNLNTYFSVVPKIKDRELGITPFPISDLISNKGKNFRTSSTFQKGDYIVEKNKKVIVHGNLKINNNLIINEGGSLTVYGSLYVGQGATLSGSLVLPNSNDFIYINQNSSISKLNLDGEMYINGSATITNDLNTNGTIYVSKGTRIENLSNTSGGTLILLCDDEITIANNNLYNDAPKIIDAYFYSNKMLEIYGMGSHMQINGGIYGNPIILNASKGKTSESNFSSSRAYGPWLNKTYYQYPQDSIDPTKSRLSIYYKKEMILNPPKGIPTVEKMQVKEIDVVYE